MILRTQYHLKQAFNFFLTNFRYKLEKFSFDEDLIKRDLILELRNRFEQPASCRVAK